MEKRNNISQFNMALLLILAITIFSSCQKRPRSATILDARHEEVKRVGMIIKIKPENLESYKALHADTVTGVRDLLTKYNLRNFSIFMTQLEDGNYYEFGYYEYWGSDFEADIEKLNDEPRNKAWLELCDTMQIPLETEVSWKEMERIYFNY